MITLGELTGLMLSDVLLARQQADTYSASISEDYHVNPFMNGMPIPHYTISELDMDIPLQIVGVQRSSLDAKVVARLIGRIRQNLPMFLYRAVKNAYYEKQEHYVAISGGTVEPETIGIPTGQPLPEQKLPDPNGPPTVSITPEIIRLSQRPELKASYKASVADCSLLMEQYMFTYLTENNLEVLKLLDFSDAFEKTLRSVCREDFSTYLETESPFIDKDSLKACCKQVSDKMYFEFRQVFQQTCGVLVDPVTGKLSEYTDPSSLMRVHLKLREQDLDFVVDKDEATGEDHRFLSLN